MFRKAAAALVLAAVLSAAGCGAAKEAKEAKAAGQEYLEAGDYAAAAAEFRKAYDNAGHAGKKYKTDLLEWLGDAQFCGGDYAGAKETYGMLAGENEKNAEFLYYLAAAEAGTEDADGALADYRRASEQDRQHASFTTPGALAAFRMTEQVLFDAERFTEAAELCNEEFAAGAEHPEVYNRAGMCCMAAGDYDKAREMFTKGQTVRVSGEDEAAQAAEEICGKELARNLAVLAERTGDYAGALEAFQAWRDRYGEDPEVEREILFLTSRVSGT